MHVHYGMVVTGIATKLKLIKPNQFTTTCSKPFSGPPLPLPCDHLVPDISFQGLLELAARFFRISQNLAKTSSVVPNLTLKVEP